MRKLILLILQFWAKKKLLRNPEIKIHSTAMVNFRAVRYRAGSHFEVGEGSIVEGSLVAEREGASIIIGRNTSIRNSLIASATKIEIGDDIFISWGCTIFDHDSHALGWKHRQQDIDRHHEKNWTYVAIKPVKIGNKSWIGLNAIILKGVEIGEGSVVAAGSVVTKSVPPWTLVSGNPAKAIREIPLEDR